MRAVLQRVSRARVTVDEREVGAIGGGLCILLGAGRGDGDAEVGYLVEKTANLRIFPDQGGRMNRSLLDAGLGVLCIPQFTLYGDARKGRRPAFTGALEPSAAEALFESFLRGLRRAGVAEVASGVFGADMAVELVNDGPVTLLLDSEKTF